MGQLMPTYYLYITYSINNQLVGFFFVLDFFVVVA